MTIPRRRLDTLSQILLLKCLRLELLIQRRLSMYGLQEMQEVMQIRALIILVLNYYQVWPITFQKSKVILLRSYLSMRMVRSVIFRADVGLLRIIVLLHLGDGSLLPIPLQHLILEYTLAIQMMTIITTALQITHAMQ